MSYKVSDGRLLLSRTEADRQPLLLRLRRAEGQLRGVIEMIESDRYCGDELHQLNAVSAALREVAIMLASDHASAVIAAGIEEGRPDLLADDLATVLRAALRTC